MPECRFCYDDGFEEKLISPCSCNGNSKWIHESCLQTWLGGITDFNKEKRCEICRDHYLIESIHPQETYILYKGWGNCGELFVGSIIGCIFGGFMWTLDGITNYTSVKIFNLESLQLPYKIKENNWLALSYYQGLCSFSLSSILFLLLLLKIHLNIKRKSVYYFEIFPKLLLVIFIITSFLFVLLLANFYRSINIISYFGILTSMLQMPYIFYYCRIHNKTIIKINKKNIGIRILSVVNNPLNCIESQRFNIE